MLRPNTIKENNKFYNLTQQSLDLHTTNPRVKGYSKILVTAPKN